MITITPRKIFDVPVVADCINPDIFNGKTFAQICKLTAYEGNRQLTLHDLFEMHDDKTKSQTITLNGDFNKVKCIGQCMKDGEIIINGNVGMHTGEKMAGGKITINGNAGGWTSGGMKDGLIEIHGDAADYLASPGRGSSEGMKGGMIIVDGNVGTDVACYMRGGVIKIKGCAGNFLGCRMSGGVIYVENKTETRVGALMRSGKIIVNGLLEEVLPSFTIDGIKQTVKVDASQTATGPFYVFLGDLAEHGFGKLFVSKKNNPHLAAYEKYL